MPLSLVAIALIITAIILLFVKWRGTGLPAMLEACAVPVAWVAFGLSALAWMTAYEPDFGLPIGFLIAMSLPLCIIGWRAFKDFRATPNTAKPRRAKAVAETRERFTARKGLRITARLLCSLILAPITGMAFGMLAWLYMPGHEATRYAWAVFAFVLIGAIVIIVGLSAQRPWRATAFVSLAGVLSSGLVSLPLLLGSH